MKFTSLAMLLVAGVSTAPVALAQSENVPPNVTEGQPSNRGTQTMSDRADRPSENPGISFVFGETPSTGDTQTVIPLAPRGNNSANNLPIDRASPK